MLDRDDTDTFLYRVAIAALNYYPDRAADDLGYTIDEDIDWCLDALLPTIPPAYRHTMRPRLHAVITDPTGQRREFRRDVLALVTGTPDHGTTPT